METDNVSMALNSMQTHSVLLRIVALSLLLYSLSLFGTSMRKLSHAEEALRLCEEELSTLEEEKRRLEEKIRAVEDGVGLDKLARDRLGLVMPDEIIYYFTDKNAALP